jgi:hypothetical protein
MADGYGLWFMDVPNPPDIAVGAARQPPAIFHRHPPSPSSIAISD